MFEHLIDPSNQIVFKEVVLDRDGDAVCSFIIGSGYGIFGSLSRDDLELAGINKYRSASIVVHYTSNQSDATIEDGVVYNQTYDEPFVAENRRKCVATWRSKTYDITEVQKKYDIHGVFVGYRVYSANG